MADWPEGVGCRIIDIVDSTNLEAARVAESLDEPQWIFAHRQTAGRGRQGAPWLSQPGNFSATLVMKLDDTPERAALRSFVSALALRDVLVKATGLPERFRVKWPNDVLANGGKVAGILLEFLQHGSRGSLLIGFGVNLASVPTIIGRDAYSPEPVSVVGETGLLIPALDFLRPLAHSFHERENQFRKSGFAPIRDAWLAHAHKLGEEITARVGKRRFRGVFRTIDDRGQIIIETAGRQQVIAAADALY